MQTVQGLEKINILQLTAKNIHYVTTMNDEPVNVSVTAQTNHTKAGAHQMGFCRR